MNVRVGSSKVTQCLLDPVRVGFQEEPLMTGLPAGGGHSQANFKRHVEARCPAGELNSTEIVERITACRDQLQDAVQSPCRSWDLECGSRTKPEAAEAGDQRHKELFVTSIVRDVEKDVMRRVSLSDRSASACLAPPRRAPLLGVLFALARQGLGDSGLELPIVFGRDTEKPSRRSRRGEGGRNYRTRTQRHGVTLRGGRFSCQRARNHTARRGACR